MISDFRVVGDQDEVFGRVASVPTAWRTLKETAAGGDRTRRKVTAAVNKARRYAWSQVIARHGQLPPVQVADRQLTGITCIRLDATVVPAHSDKEQAQPNFKGFGHHPVLAECDNVREPLAWMMRPGSAGSNTAADHLKLVDEAIAALPPQSRRKLMVLPVDVPDYQVQQLVFRGKVVVQRTGRQPASVSDVPHGGRQRAALVKEFDGRLGEICLNIRAADGQRIAEILV